MRQASLFLLLGLLPFGSADAAGSNAQSIPVKFVYRNDTAPDDGRTVIFQGDEAGPSLESYCGASASRCSCVFYRHTSDGNPLAGIRLVLSRQYNNLRCELPGAADPDDFKLARLETRDKQFHSSRTQIKTSLTLKDVVGDLDQGKVRGIFRYSCTRTFFEGEGVTPTSISCPASQRLGLITAKYNFYLHNSQLGGNLHEKSGDTPFEFPICERQFTKLSCAGAPDLRWGLAAERTSIFQVGITMTAKPEGENATSLYGFAAIPDQMGNCPVGLEKIRPWIAQPQSIIQGSIDGTNPPSSFINENNNLNNVLVEPARPRTFQVNRQANQTPCEPAHSDPSPRPAPGSCVDAGFGGSTQVQNVSYMNLSPVVCAIPQPLLPPM